MVLISGDLKLATLTKSVRDAETKDNLDLSINIDGNDVVSRFALIRNLIDNMIHRGNASILVVPDIVGSPMSFDSDLLTNSSVRVGITGDNAWRPEHILLLGREVAGGRYIPLAVEMDLDIELSTDPTDSTFPPGSKLTMPLRLVGLGGIGTTIRRVALLVRTSTKDDAGSDNHIELEIVAGGVPVLRQEIGDTSQMDRVENAHNWYFLDSAPFNKRNVMLPDNGIRLRIKGRDAWLPRDVYVFGFDTAVGRPTQIVPLVSVTGWDLGWLSADTSEGQESVLLPIS